MEEVSAAFGLFGREDALRVVNDVLVSGGNVVAIGDPGVGKSSVLRVAAQLAKALSDPASLTINLSQLCCEHCRSVPW